jgi:hypothetical protein
MLTKRSIYSFIKTVGNSLFLQRNSVYWAGNIFWSFPWCSLGLNLQLSQIPTRNPLQNPSKLNETALSLCVFRISKRTPPLQTRISDSIYQLNFIVSYQQFHIYSLSSAHQIYDLISWNTLGSCMLLSDAVTPKRTWFTGLVESSVELTKCLYAMKQTSISV